MKLEIRKEENRADAIREFRLIVLRFMIMRLEYAIAVAI
jgi:hypothetical protein